MFADAEAQLLTTEAQTETDLAWMVDQRQLPDTADILARAGLRTRTARCDLPDATVVVGSTGARVPSQL